MKFNHKLGTSKAGPRTRVWLEGARLLAVGFKHKAFVSREWGDGKLTLRVVSKSDWNELKHSERGIVAGAPDRPIIDITGEKVRETFKAAGEFLSVDYAQDRITITAAKES
jgi:hypothetical protein